MTSNNNYFKLLSKYTNNTIDFAIVKHLFEPREVTSSILKLYLITYDTPENLIQDLLQETKIKPLLPLSNYKNTSRQNNFRLLDISLNKNDLGAPPSEMKTSIRNDKRGLTVVEGLWLSLLFPSILERQALDLLESTYSIECIPTLYKWNTHSYLSAVCPDVSDSMCGAPLVERELYLEPEDFTSTNVFMKKIRTLNNTNFEGVSM